MTRLHLTACLLVVAAALGTARAAEPLAAADVEAALAGATTSGINVYGNPYTVRIQANGSIDGVAGASDEYADSGSWWMEGDSFCRRWNTWLDAATACFAVSIEGDQITWIDVESGTAVVESYTPAP